MATYTIQISSSLAPTPSKQGMTVGQTVQWHNNGSSAVTISFGTWPFSEASGDITVPAGGDSGTYTAKNVISAQNDGYTMRDGKTTGSGEIDLGIADDFEQPSIG